MGRDARQFTKLLLSLLSHIGWEMRNAERGLRSSTRPTRRSVLIPQSAFRVPHFVLGRDATAESNRRGQACEILIGTGNSRR